MKYIKTYNERLGDKFSAPNDSEILSKLKSLSTDKIIEQSTKNNFKLGFKYILDERKSELNNDEIYILEKYGLDLHQHKKREYETWFKKQLSGLESFPSKDNKNFIIYKKDNIILYNYDLTEHTFWIEYNNIWCIFEFTFKIKTNYIKLLTKHLVEKYLNLKIITIEQFIVYHR